MTEKYNYGFTIDYRIAKHVDMLMKNNEIDFSEKGINVSFNHKSKREKSIKLSLNNVSASQAVKRLLWILTHLASIMNDFDRNSLDFMAMRLITEAIRNLLLTTNGQGTKLKEWFKSDNTMRVVIFGDEKSKLFVALDRYPKNSKVNY